jgi:hypothetical protein
MVVQESQPAPDFALVPAALEVVEIAGNGRFGKHEPELKQLAVNTWCSQVGVFRLDLPNENANLCTDLGLARLSGVPTPERRKPARCQDTTVSGLTRMRASA